MNKRRNIVRPWYLACMISLAAGFSAGCHELSGTQWAVTAIEAKGVAKPVNLGGISTVLIEFGSDGRLQTTVQYEDGKIEIEDDEKYEAWRGTIVIRHPNYEERLQYELSGSVLLVSSDKYNVKLERSSRPVASSETADRPAMFRPSSIDSLVYRRLSTMRK